MIRTTTYDASTGHIEQGGAELIETWRQNEQLQIWVDLDGGRDEDDRELLTEFAIHPLAIQDALRSRHPPKVEEFDDFVFILLRGLDANTKGIDFGVIQLALFVGDRFFITRHSKPSVSANWLWGELDADPAAFAEGPGGLAVRLSNRMTRRYVEILLELEPRLDEIEEEMFEAPNDALLAELTGYKSRLRNLNRIASYHRIIAARLRSGMQRIPESLEHEVTDLYEQIERTQSLATLYYDLAHDLTDGYLALSSHRLNRVMQILTVITVIFVPLTFLAGIYGMNFENMPELGTQTGYFIVLGVMFGAAIVQLIFFRRRGWV